MSANTRNRASIVALLGLACAAGCGSPQADDTLQRTVMHDLALNVMLPIQEELDAAAAPLPKSLEALCATPTEDTLKAAQSAWRAARAPWKLAEAFRFGPAEDQRLGSALDFWPARPDSIESAITSAPEPATADYVASLGTSAKGLPALEYMIFDPVGGNAAILGALGAGDAASKRRCAYAHAVAETIAKDAMTLHQAWSPDGDDFVAQVSTAGTGSKLLRSGQDGVSIMLNRLIAVVQLMSETKLGAPLGRKTGTGPDPSLVESRFSDNSLEDLLGNLQGIEDIYTGKHGTHTGHGMADLLRTNAAPVDAAVQKALADAVAKTKAIPGPLRTTVVANPDAVGAAIDSVKTLRRLLSADVASVLGVSVSLNDSDAD